MNKIFNKFNWQVGITEAYEHGGHTWAFLLYSIDQPPLPRMLPVDFQLPKQMCEYKCYVRHKEKNKIEHSTAYSHQSLEEWKTKT